MMGEQHRLGALEMGVAREIGVARLHGPVQQGVLELDDRRAHRQQLPARVEAQVGGDLVVATAAGVELRPHVAGELGDPAFHRGVDVLVPGVEDEDPRGQLLLDPVERGEQHRRLTTLEHPGARQPPHVGARAGQVVAGQAAVVGQAGGEGHDLLGGAAETALPQGHDSSAGRPGFDGAGPPWRAAHVASPSPHKRTNPAASACSKVSVAS